MNISIFDLFKIGIGPSSSHTVGPMKAAKKFLLNYSKQNSLNNIARITIDLHGSLALTGIGHGTDKAILLGILGEDPDRVDIASIDQKIDQIKSQEKISLLGEQEIKFIISRDLNLITKSLPQHPNGMVFTIFSQENEILAKQTYFSIGGGFVISELELSQAEQKQQTPYPFKNAAELLEITSKENKSIAEIIYQNELVFYSKTEIKEKIAAIWKVMQESVTNGCKNSGTLPGGLNVQRRSAALHKKLQQDGKSANNIFDWISLFALAVNEENAAYGRVVTAPTNGAAGIIPAILHYYEAYYHKLTIDELLTFFMTSAAIGLLYKENASISGAEMGCQGEVGVACSMAAAGLTALCGGSNEQIEAAAEIGMEHNLGLTCDPIKGLVQIPCIERNTMGAIKAINASRLAMNNEHAPKISLDKVILTMKQTGNDMKSRYKETSRGGLAINVIEC